MMTPNERESSKWYMVMVSGLVEMRKGMEELARKERAEAGKAHRTEP